MYDSEDMRCTAEAAGPRYMVSARLIRHAAFRAGNEALVAAIDQGLERRSRMLAGLPPLPPSAQKDLARRKPVPRARHWQEQILAMLVELGYNPLSLPPAQIGRASAAKQQVKAALRMTDAVFKAAWQQLRDSGEIKDR